MLVVMRHDARAEDIRAVVQAIEAMGYEARPMPGRHRTTVGVVGNEGRVDGTPFSALEGVQDILHVTPPYKLVSREWKADATIVRLPGGLTIGGEEVPVIAGPCSVEGERQLLQAAHAVKEAGATLLRAGAFKPRSSPYSFQGLGREGLKLLALARRETGLLIVTEAVDPEGVDWVAEAADVIQIGARNMQNYSLLRRAGRAGKPVLLKRGIAATIEELLLAAEYLLAEGNPDVILCERGIRSFDTETRFLLDLGAIPTVHALSHLPIIADPSHGTGRRDLVPAMACAALAAGADGLLVEVHPNPGEARSDGAQSLRPEQFERLMADLRPLAEAVGRRIAEPVGART